MKKILINNAIYVWDYKGYTVWPTHGQNYHTYFIHHNQSDKTIHRDIPTLKECKRLINLAKEVK